MIHIFIKQHNSLLRAEIGRVQLNNSIYAAFSVFLFVLNSGVEMKDVFAGFIVHSAIFKHKRANDKPTITSRSEPQNMNRLQLI